MSDDGSKSVGEPGGQDDAHTLYPSSGAGGAPGPLPRLRSDSVLFGVYRIEERMGRGGMGEIYRAEHVTMHEPRAIKMMLPELSERSDLMDRFFREARALLEVHHPAVVKCHDLLKDDEGHFFLVMEYIDGPSLGARLERGALSPEETRALGERLAAGLAAAHERLVHRDLSPDNVMLPGGDAARAKLIDFGIAKEIAGARTTADFVGKYSWASPEQLGMGSREVDYRSDYYSLGLVLCTAALGRRLPLGNDPASAIRAREELAAAGPPAEIPEALRNAIGPLLCLDPDERPRSIVGLFSPANFEGSPGGATRVLSADDGSAFPEVIPEPPRHPDTTVTNHPRARWVGWMGAALVGGAIALAAANAWLDRGTRSNAAAAEANGRAVGSDAALREASEPPAAAPSALSAYARARMALLDAGGTLPSGATRLALHPMPLTNGASFEIQVMSDCDCNPLIFSVNGPGDRIDLLYPNALDPMQRLAQGESLQVPTNHRYELTASASAAGEPDDELVLLLVPDSPEQLSIPASDLLGLSGGEMRWSATDREADEARSEELLRLLASLEDRPWIATRTRLEIER